MQLNEQKHWSCVGGLVCCWLGFFCLLGCVLFWEGMSLICKSRASCIQISEFSGGGRSSGGQ